MGKNQKPLVKPDSQECEKWQRLFEQYNRVVYHRAYQCLRNQQDAEDAVQNTFIKVSQHLDCIDEANPRKALNYILTILENQIRDHVRHEKRKPEETEQIEEMPAKSDGDISEVERIVFTKDELRNVYHYVMTLDEKYKMVFLLRYFNGFGLREMAELTGVSAGTLSVWLNRARQKVLDYIRKKGE